jgi:hypothetical protein
VLAITALFAPLEKCEFCETMTSCLKSRASLMVFTLVLNAPHHLVAQEPENAVLRARDAFGERVGVDPARILQGAERRAGQQQPAAREALGELAHSHGLLRFARLNQQERRRQWAAWRTALRTINKATKSTL